LLRGFPNNPADRRAYGAIRLPVVLLALPLYPAGFAKSISHRPVWPVPLRPSATAYKQGVCPFRSNEENFTGRPGR